MCCAGSRDDQSAQTALPQTVRLLEIMARLRAPGGCPWDREQTLESLKPYLVEECGEVLEAIEEGDTSEHADELGDLLLQVVFQCQISCEHGDFDFEEVARRISEKLIRRHPHVFSDVEVSGSEDVVRNWEEIKARERECGDSPEDTSILDGIPRHLPSLMRARELQEQAADVGFDWEEDEGVLEKIAEEVEELREATATMEKNEIREEIGDLLFSIVNLSRRLDIGAEEALNHCIQKFKQRFRAVEEGLAERGKTPEESSLEEMDELWDEAKERE
jgi:MazG family protein